MSNEPPDKDNKSDYAVGYGRPPKATQFRPGQSGNRKGRPKQSKNLKTHLRDELKAIVTITEQGRRKKVSKSAIIIRQIVNRAAQGDHKSQALLLGEMRRIELDDQSKGESVAKAMEIRPEDQHVLDSILARARRAKAEVTETAEADITTKAEIDHDNQPE